MTYEEIVEYAGGNLSEIVKTYIWEPETKEGDSYNVTIRIEVRKRNGRYLAIPSHKVKTPKQASPYVSLDDKDTPEAALYSCISGFRMFMGTPEETEWHPLKW